MVFLSNMLQAVGYRHGPHNFWRRMQVFRYTWHFYGRNRRCFKLAIQGMHKAFQHSNRSRQIRGLALKELWQTRIDAACKEHGLNYFEFSESLTRQNIQLNHLVLNHIAIYEPRTFESLCLIAKQHIVNTGLYELNLDPPKGVYNRAMFTDEVNQM